jgi:hypothetical protein
MPTLTDPCGWFTLEVPDGWTPWTEDGVTTLRSPGGVGVMYLGGGRHAGGRQESFGRAEFLARFLRSLGIAVDDGAIASAESIGCRIYSWGRDSDGACWRYFSVTDDETALLISYVCRSEDVGKESAEVDTIVRSVRLYHSAPVH